MLGSVCQVPPGEKNLTQAIQHQQVILKKHSCNCSWCLSCFRRRSAPTIAAKLQEYDFERTRQLILTIDPSKFSNGYDAVVEISKKRAIAAYMRDLGRSEGIHIDKWLWVREWHKNGFPHWHLFVEVDKKGKAGQIGHAKAAKRWRYGYVREDYIRNAEHWDKFTKYFGKKGYFDKNKAHQAQLPSWAIESKIRIRRFATSVDPTQKEELTKNEKSNRREKSLNRLENWRKKMSNLLAPSLLDNLVIFENPFAWQPGARPYKVILEECGASTVFTVMYKGVEEYGGMIRLGYYDMIAGLTGTFRPGVGYVIDMHKDEFFEWLKNTKF
jgi:hypothetical protein